MREIKFRGYSLEQTRWVYGYYVKKHNTHVILEEDRTSAFSVSGVEVQGETVGQYTGIKDENGKEIYEGDILLFPDGRCGDVQWKKYLAGFHTNDFRTIEKEMVVIGTIHEKRKN